MKKINVNEQDEQVQRFIRSLPIDRGGCILVLDGKALLEITPIKEVVVDKAKLKAAILNRRDESRKLNDEWEAADRALETKLTEEE